MLAAGVITLASIICFPVLIGAQGTTLIVPGNPGVIRDHGAGVKTFQDSAGSQGTVTDLGNGFSIFRDSHGGTKPLTAVSPGVQLGEIRQKALPSQERGTAPPSEDMGRKVPY
jgi:hypothetical protein